MARPARHADFFRVWSPEMAYVLGLWWTDGCMRVKTHGAHEIEIASNDREHLVHVAECIGGNYHVRPVAKGSNTYKITFCSVEMYLDIQRLGGSPRKSRTISFPDIPTALLPHFVRGVVDGDGTLSWNGDRPVVHIYSGSTKFLDNLVAAVEWSTGIPAPTRAANRDNWYVKWSTVRAKCLTAWLYVENAGLALPRKAQLAHEILAWQPKKTPNDGTITPIMRWRFAEYLEQPRIANSESDSVISDKTQLINDDRNTYVQLQLLLE